MVEIAEDKLFLENDRQDVPEAGRVLPGIRWNGCKAAWRQDRLN